MSRLAKFARPATSLVIYAILSALIVVPFLSFLAMSFFSMEGVTINRTPTMGNFLRAFTDPVMAAVFWRTILLCGAIAFVTTLIAYPVAVFINGLQGVARYVLLTATTAPLILSYVMKIYAFRSILGGNGLLNRDRKSVV